MPMDANPYNHSPVQCSPELARAARQAVRNAAAAKFSPEPLFEPDLAKFLSTCSSVVKRHGPLVQAAIAETLAEGGLEVWQNVKVPYTRTAMAFVVSPDYSLNRDRRLTHDQNDIAGYFDADILAVDDEFGWACALQVRRGGGATEPVKRKRMEREIRALDLTLGSWLRQAGFPRVETCAVALVDWLGLSGFPEEIVLHGERLDEFLGEPASAKIAAMNETMRSEVEGLVKDLSRPLLAAMDEARRLNGREISNEDRAGASTMQTLRPRPRVQVSVKESRYGEPTTIRGFRPKLHRADNHLH